MPCSKKSIACSNSFSPGPAICLLLAAGLVLTGCARQPWGTVLDQEAHEGHRQRLLALQEGSRQCSQTLDAEAVVGWKSAFETISFAGFIQIKTPASIKFTASNPLGQPLFAAATDGSSFQSINTMQRRAVSGSLRSFALLHDIPEPFVTGQWGEWLTGRPGLQDNELIEIRQDTAARGIWYGLAPTVEAEMPSQRLLIDAEGKVTQRVVLDAGGDPLATISYERWQELDGCPQPLIIAISGLSFGAQAQLELSDVRTAELGPKNFSLPVPPGYTRQLMP